MANLLEVLGLTDTGGWSDFMTKDVLPIISTAADIGNAYGGSGVSGVIPIFEGLTDPTSTSMARGFESILPETVAPAAAMPLSITFNTGDPSSSWMDNLSGIGGKVWEWAKDKDNRDLLSLLASGAIAKLQYDRAGTLAVAQKALLDQALAERSAAAERAAEKYEESKRYGQPLLYENAREAFAAPQVSPTGQAIHFANNSLGALRPRTVVAAAKGGALSSLLKGRSGGQDDTVPAALSPGEYVMDADTVSSLGDGNNEAGARRLDEMRVGLRKHKRSAPATKIPPKAKNPLAYVKKGAR